MIIIYKDCLFSFIFTNIYLKSLIFKYIRLYNIFSYSRYFVSIDSIIGHKFKEYLKEIEIDGSRINRNSDDILFSDDEDDDDDEDDNGAGYSLIINNLNLLPNNIDTIKLLSEPNLINNNNNINNNNSINNNNNNNNNFIKKLIIFYKINNNNLNKSKLLNNQLSTINKLHLYRVDSKFKLISSNLPESITELILFEYHYEIKKESLPSGLIKLDISFDGLKKSMFEKGSLPNSLTSLVVHCFSQQFTFKTDILPKRLELLKIVSSIYQELPKDYKFPESLVHLELKCKELKIKLPSNLKFLNIQTSNIKNNSLPPLLKYLKISTCQPITSKLLPKYLLSLETDADSIGPSILPNSLQRLIFRSDISGLLNFNIKLVPSIIPQNIVHLDLDFDGYGSFNNGGFPMIQDNLFPQSLEFLNLGNGFNQSIGKNTLPRSLKTLILGINFSQEIIQGTIPTSVLYFNIKNPSYQHLVKLENHFTIFKICDNNNHYFQHYISNPKDLRVLRLSSNFNQPLKVLQLQDKSNLLYLHLNKLFNQIITLEDLPIYNSIKTLVLGNSFSNIINLEYFQNLELLNVKNSNPIIKTSLIINQNQNQINNNYQNHQNNNQKDIVYNFYKLKIIQVRAGNNKFLDNLDPVFYHLVRLSKEKEKKSKNMY